MASRFAELDLSVSDFIKENENENTMRKIKQNGILGNFKGWDKFIISEYEPWHGMGKLMMYINYFVYSL